MDLSGTQPMTWSERDSQNFIERGHIHTPARDEIERTILEMLPARADESFTAVELGVGSGWLSEAILRSFPGSRIIGFDGSQTMLREAAKRLQQFAGRVDLCGFQLEDVSWLSELTRPVRCIMSVLMIHHLGGPEKKSLYRELYTCLEPGGAVLIADLVAPRSEQERRYMATEWDREVKRQSLEFTGNLDTYNRFVEEHSNWYEYPDPADMPSTIPEHLEWLEEAGFAESSVFWMRAGHAIYGGYKG